MQVDGRRLVRALTLSALSFLLVGGVTGFAMAQGEAGEVLTVPVPRPGDSATYTVRMGLDPDLALGGYGDAAIREVRYEWLPQEWVLDADFGVHLAAPLRATYTFATASHSLTYYYDTTTHDVLAAAQDAHSDSPELPVSPGVGGPLRLLPIPGSSTDSRFEMYGGDLGACGVWTPIHGHPDGRFAFEGQGTCGWEEAPGDRPVAHFAPYGWVDTRPWKQGPRTHTFYFDDADRGLDVPRLGLWYSDASPFPVRLRNSMAEYIDEDWAVGRVYMLERTSSSPGDGRYEVAANVAPGPGPVPLVPATPWVVDDAELGWDFPLSQAYAAALADKGDATLPDDVDARTVSAWLRSHPDGYLAFAVTINVEDGSGTPRTEWIMIWADGRTGAQWIAKRVAWTTQVEGTGFVLPQQSGRHARVEDWVPSWLPDDTTGFFPSRQQLPTEVPDLAAAIARYHGIAGADAPFDRYGVQVYCFRTCDDPHVLVEAGHVLVNDGGEAQVVDPASSALDKVLVGRDGRLAYRSQQVQSSDGLLPGATAPQPLAPTGATTTLASTWVAPSAQAATSISFLALVAGVLYYFWPAVKGAGLGLFSRTRDDELLEHPRRAQILQLVQTEPGIHFQDLGRRLTLGRGTLEHHLRKMVAANLLTKVRHGGYACYFPKGAVDRRLMAAAPLLRSASGRSILTTVRERPGLSGRQIALELGLSQSTVSYHLRRLEQAGLVFGAGAATGVRLSPLGEQAAA